MTRVTRKKAAEIAEQLHVDEDAVLDLNADDAAIRDKLATPEHDGRSPLGEIEPNSAESKMPEDAPADELKKSTRGRKAGKRGTAKGRKDNLAASTATAPEEGDVVPDDNESTPSPASEKAAEDLIGPEPELSATNIKLQDRSQSPPSAAVRLTRSQLAKKAETETEPKSLVDGIDQASDAQGSHFVSDNGSPTIETSAPIDLSETTAAHIVDAPTSPPSSAVPNIIKNLRSDTPAKRSTSNKENVQPETDASSMGTLRMQSSMYDALEDAVVAAATPPRSEAHPSPRPEDSIAALDELEDAVEIVSKDIPDVPTSPQKPEARKDKQQIKPEAGEDMPKIAERKAEVKRGAKKAAPVVRTTKAAQARLSMAQNKDAPGNAPVLGRPRPSVALGRSTSGRQSVAPKAEGVYKRVPSNPTTSTAARAKSLKASTDGEPREKKEALIPHSKPRPISLSFPTPPPPTKSTKATTQSTFQLPGEAVAAKLKAAREARLAREAEEAERKEKKVAFKARPAPKTAGEAPSVRQTNASRARESIMTGKPAPAPSAATSHKRSNTVGTVDRPRAVSKDTSKPAATTLSALAAPRPRPSTSLANISKVRSSLASKPATSTNSVVSTQRTTSATTKGKEVFSRAANAKAAAEKDKAEKEAAAKRARAEAAERGRVASREWAEKQRLRKLGQKPESVKKVGEPKAETIEAVGGTAVEGAQGAGGAVDAAEGREAVEQIEAAAA